MTLDTMIRNPMEMSLKLINPELSEEIVPGYDLARAINLVGVRYTDRMSDEEAVFIIENLAERLREYVESPSKNFGENGIKERIRRNLSCLEHGYASNLDAHFAAKITKAFANGNSQTEAAKEGFKILYVNTKAKEVSQGKDERLSTYDLVRHDEIPEDLSQYSVIVIDNFFEKGDRHIGKGIDVLRQISGEVDVPILYQTAFRLEEMVDEIKQIEAFPNTIVTKKDMAFKQVKDKETAEKECEISRLCSNNEDLAEYIARVKHVGERNYIELKDGRCIVATEKVSFSTFPEPDEKRKELCEKLDLNDDDIATHQMYVLSMFHTYLKDQLDNPKLRNNEEDIPKFYDFNVFREELGEDVEKFRELYEKISKDPEHLEERIISHNDAKHENWFDYCALGDFANAAPGTEYKDIARTMLTFSDKPDQVDDGIDGYIKLREHIDDEFKVDDKSDFKKKVHEAMFTESLRLAYFKKIRDQGNWIVKNYLSIADKYFNQLK